MTDALDIRPRHTFRPISAHRPVGREPVHSGFKAADLNVSTANQSVELLAVAEKPPADGRALYANGRAVGSSGANQVRDAIHSALIGNITGRVNGYLTGRPAHPARSFYRTMIADVVARIHKRLEATGLSARAASLAAGLSEDAIRNLERGVKTRPNQGASTRTIAALAPVLKTTASWLMSGDNEDVNSGTSRTVAVVGLVGAGSVANLFSEGQGPFDEVEAPYDATESTVALGIRGASLGPAFDEGIVFYDDVRSPVTPDLHGRLCVVGLEDGRVLVKVIRSAGDGTFHLISNTVEEPMLNQPVMWAARVKDVRPR